MHHPDARAQQQEQQRVARWKVVAAGDQSAPDDQAGKHSVLGAEAAADPAHQQRAREGDELDEQDGGAEDRQGQAQVLAGEAAREVDDGLDAVVEQHERDQEQQGVAVLAHLAQGAGQQQHGEEADQRHHRDQPGQADGAGRGLDDLVDGGRLLSCEQEHGSVPQQLGDVDVDRAAAEEEVEHDGPYDGEKDHQPYRKVDREVAAPEHQVSWQPVETHAPEQDE
jgi:hypothetical protein